MILENCHNRNTNLSIAWIDCKKAFDNVPHSWIEKYLEMFKISSVLRNFLSHSMRVWKTTLVLNTVENTLNAGDININSGIYQGDSLSPILFCVTLIPLSKLLNNTGYCNKPRNTINHLFYMDELKLFAKNDQQLQGLLSIVKQFSDDIRMEFGLDKCAKATFFRGKLLKAKNITLNTTTIIKDLEPEESYEYLGVTEGNGIQHSSMRENIRKECFRRVRSILRSILNARNRIDGINSLALLVATYSFTIINWSITEIKKVVTKIRKLLAMLRMHHPKSDVNRLYFPCKEGGRGLVQLELSLKTSFIGMDTYLNNTNDWMLKLVKKQEENKRMYSITSDAKKYLNEINLSTDNICKNSSSAEKARQIKTQAKTKNINELREGWKDKPVHGKYSIRASDPDVNSLLTDQWLLLSGLKSETESFIVAAQDQSLSVRNFQANILENGDDPKFRVCDKHTETIDHLVSGCPILAPTEYLNRHDRLGQYIYCCLCKNFCLPHERNWWEHKPPTVIENKNDTIF